MSDDNFTNNAERSLVAFGLGAATLIMCVGALLLR